MKYVGLDLSLTHAGVAVLDDEVAPRLGVFGSEPAGPLLKDRWRRLSEHTVQVVNFIDSEYVQVEDVTQDRYDEVHVAIEQPAYAQTQGSQHDRSGFWWMVIDSIANCRLTEIGPSVLKKFATGKGNASKAEMMARTAQDFPGLAFRDDNDSDALWLATMARAHADPDLSPVPMLAFRTAALKSVVWG